MQFAMADDYFLSISEIGGYTSERDGKAVETDGIMIAYGETG